jgi:sterol desaturase/sphingolipid hydroxylase (fatty acid hydroxylase superfamily)
MPMPSYLADGLVICIPGMLFVLAILVGRILERAWPIEAHQSFAEIAIDYRLAALNLLANAGLAMMPTLFASVTGAGLIRLEADGWQFIPSLLIYLLTLDLMLYWFHRAQHRIPILWAMHSLHHSGEALTVSSGARHFWLEGPLKRAFLFPLTAWIFSMPATVLAAAIAIYFLIDSCAHLNVRICLGRFTLCINNPQYHRIHHSACQVHVNRNFADLLPLWDILFGTIWRPSPADWPATGLGTAEKPSSLLDGLLWPLRQYLRPVPTLK